MAAVAVPLASLSQALEAPIEFPPLRMAILPSDQVAIALSPGVANGFEVIQEVVEYLRLHEVPLSQIHVVLAPQLAEQLPRLVEQLTSLGLPTEAASVHDSQETTGMEYIAADEEALPIYLNRILADADVVLPICALSAPQTFDYFGPQGILPWFLDASSQRRYQAANQEPEPIASLARAERGMQLGMLSGVSVAIVYHRYSQRFVCGPLEALFRFQEESEATNLSVAALPPDLIVATIEDPEAQLWENVARIVYGAGNILGQDGVLVLCTQVTQRPIGALTLLASTEESERIENQLRRSNLPYTEVAQVLLAMRSRMRIYLQSEIADDVIEELGIGVLHGSEEILRLAEQAKQGWLVRDAQYVAFPTHLSTDLQ